MMSQDNRLIPVSAIDRSLDRPLAEIAQSKPYGVAAESTHLRDYLFVILKRKWLILSLVLVVTSLVTIQMSRLPAIYEAEALIRIEPKQSSVLKSKDVVITAPDPNFWGTQLKLLENPALARQVVLTLDLPNNPNFFGGQAQGGIFSSLRRILSRPKGSGAAPAAPTGLNVITENELAERELSSEELAKLEPYEDAIISGETIEPQPQTNLVKIKFQHPDPSLAQKIANTLADVFAKNNLERTTEGSQKASHILAREISNFQTKIKQRQEEMFNYARNHNLPLNNEPDGNLEAKRLMTLSNQLLDAENDRKNLQAQYESAKNTGDPFSVPDVVNSERIARLRDRISALKEKRDSLLVTYTPEWPEVKKVEAELRPLEAEVSKGAREIVNSMKSRHEAAIARENDLRRSYQQQRGTTTQQTRDQIGMLQMSQELETDKQYLNTLLQKQKELSGGSSETNEVTISSYSRFPRAPIGPPRLRNIMIAFLLSLVAGIGLAFLLDFLDDTVKSLEDVDRYLHIPALALIPASRNERARLLPLGGQSPGGPHETTALAMIEDVRSPIAESYRHLRTSLLLSSAGQPPKTILITSSQPSEGKTTTAINTAFMLAQTGAEVLIVDCDLRRPRLHVHFDLPNGKGLTNWLSGETELDKLIQSYDKNPNLKLLTSGPVPPNPAELLGSDEMRKLLKILGERFSHIVLDSPPAISFTDASILSTMVDGVVLVVHGGRSSRAVVRRAKQQLLDVGAHIFGIVLNNVKLETQDYYYSGYYSRYYTEGEEGTADEGKGAEA